jgi:hypothetical protein
MRTTATRISTQGLWKNRTAQPLLRLSEQSSALRQRKAARHRKEPKNQSSGESENESLSTKPVNVGGWGSTHPPNSRLKERKMSMNTTTIVRVRPADAFPHGQSSTRERLTHRVNQETLYEMAFIAVTIGMATFLFSMWSHARQNYGAV